jgi:predicted acetyltransferase
MSKPSVIIHPATITDYPLIQHMWLFYIYDMSRECGFIKGWECPANPSFVPDDITSYFKDPARRAYLIKVDDEPAGFALLNQAGTLPETQWNMGEFFILARYQEKGIGTESARQLWNMHPDLWEVSVIPENKNALDFWRKVISNFTDNRYVEAIKDVDYDQNQPKRYVLSFDTKNLQLGDCQIKSDKNYKITFVDELNEEISKRMSDGFIAYEASHGIDVNYKRLSVVISNEKNIACGVINAYTAFAEIYVDDIWVDSAYRGKGYGRLLLQALEEHFQGQGFNNINLVTSAFQAPEFYKKCGFIAEFTRINKVNHQLSKTFFVKFFEEEKQTQGLLLTKKTDSTLNSIKRASDV